MLPSAAMLPLIDLRSDTVTRPDAAMRAAMAAAPVGDDVYGEDPTVALLEGRLAELFGFEAGLFVPTGVMSNQLCLKVLTLPGDEVILGEQSHIFNYETGAPALLSGLQLHTVAEEMGGPDLSAAEEAIREEAYYLPTTRLLAVEQTHNRLGGVVIPQERMQALASLAAARGLSLHIDGARIWNALVATGLTARAMVEGAATLSVCLSKGLGAPVGSVMLASAERIAMARRFRKIWGGGWRQAGILAAAGLHALDHNVEALAADHLRAARFASLLDAAAGLELLNVPQTNIVLFRPRSGETERFVAQAAERGVLVSAAFKGKLRAVFHRDIDDDMTERAAAVLSDIAREQADNLHMSDHP